MKLFRFRSIANECEFKKTKEILVTDKFWCSSFWELNDPMEGIFWYSIELKDNELGNITDEKKNYKICSFSGMEAFSNPIMWGYYAGGFKGIAIEVQVNKDKDSINSIKYVGKDEDFKFVAKTDDKNSVDVKEILTTKLCKWSHEDEYRFLKKNVGRKNKIGKITAVYFGAPYEGSSNFNSLKDKKNISEFLKWKYELTQIAIEKKIKYFDVEISGNKVICNKNKCI